MIFLQIALIFAYFVFAAWLTFATYINYVLLPFRKSQWTIRAGVSWTYAVLWGFAFSAPIAYGMIFEGSLS